MSATGREQDAASASSTALDEILAGITIAPFMALVWAAYFGIALAVYAPSLTGSFISDDQHYVQENIYVHEMSMQNIAAILDPTADPAKMVENYAPVHLLLHSVEWQFFERDVTGYHVVNVAMHALASLLLVLFFTRFGISRLAAVIAGAAFLLHPANVEAVAWISQLKTSAALVLCLAALLVQARRPWLGTVLFALALFAKPTAAVALFALALIVFLQRSRPNVDDRKDQPIRELPDDWRWVAAWALVFGLFALAEFWAFNKTAGQAPIFYEDPVVRLRTIFAIALRYLVMAATATGMSTFHEPPAAESSLDPWFVASLVVLAALATRFVVVLRARSPEAIFWGWAAVSFAPISGVIPLPFPMADRYLYFILPGLIGGLLFAGPCLARRVAALGSLQLRADWVRWAAVILAIFLVVQFANRSQARSFVWLNGNSMMADAERNYPEGLPAQTRIAHRRAMEGDAAGTVEALRKANRRGYNRLDHLISDPGYDRIRHDPIFQQFVDEVAQGWLDRFLLIEDPSELELRLIAQALIVQQDLDGAIDAIERGVAQQGPMEEELRGDLEDLRRAKRIRDSTKK